MKLSLRKPSWLITLLVLVPVIACVSGGADQVPIGSDCANGFCGGDAGPTFTAPPVPEGGEGGDASIAPKPALLACVGTTCPDPYASCSKTPSFRCETNLQNDPANCGACGVSCQGFEGINMGSRCVKGACAFECLIKLGPDRSSHVFRDCNSLVDDGCEVDITADVANCGACGNTCAAGQHCISGKCGCPAGKTDCNGRCTDTRFDDSNCNTCGHVCEYMPASACNPLRPNTGYGCALSQCDQLKCQGGYADCNHDLSKGCASDGCETDVSSDPNNCGACGLKCGPQQECRNEGNGPQCLDTCAKAGQAQCSDGCHDLLSDRFACGACGNACPNPRAHQAAGCKKGFCKLECLPGFADCNGDPSDGCEVDLSVHPANCGACGHACDFGVGQPCIEGKCLMVECDAGPTK
jgi:hypothetical protein